MEQTIYIQSAEVPVDMTVEYRLSIWQETGTYGPFPLDVL